MRDIVHNLFLFEFSQIPMQDKKLTLEELANLGEDIQVDLNVLNNKDDGLYNLIKEEIDDFTSRPVQKREKKKNSFFETIPNTELKKSIEEVFKTRNRKDEIAKKQAQYEFDIKMARIRKIKSKTYRKIKRREKLKKEEMLEDMDSDECSDEENESDIEELRPPIISFNNKDKESDTEETILNEYQEMVEKAFEVPGFEGNEKDFLSEKSEIIKEDAPQTIEHCLPGWGEWAGEDIEFQKTKYNTIIENKDGIKNSDRQDFKKNNVIINENIQMSEKYKSTLPYGYSYRDYKEKLKTPISLETSSSKVFNRFVKFNKKDEHVPGQVIKPREFEPEY